LQVPYVRDGLVAAGKLTAALIRADGAVPTATYEKKLWIYPRRPFYRHQKWLEDLHIIVYDPKDTTAALLKKLDVPFEEIRNLSLLAEINQGLVVVGEGVSFDEERGLGGDLIKAAARGVRVLCLAPADGTLPLPERDGTRGPAQLLFHDASAITRLDKKLDARAWQGAPQIVVTAVAPKAADGAVVAEVKAGSAGWPWLELRYANQGRLIVVGFGMMKHWDAGPSPRFLFARILEDLAKTHDTEPMP
jgi:hypothetical protein